MTLSQLEYFCAVCRYHSITRAAEALFVSQPTISTAIKDLENEFHISLFVHSRNRIRLTEDGAAFYHRAEELLKRTHDLYNEFSRVPDTIRPIKIGIPPILSTVFLPALSEEFERTYHIPIELSECASHRAAELVEDEELDILLGNLDIYNLEKYNYHVILEDEYVYCISKSHPLAALPAVTLPMLQNENLMLFHKDSVQVTTIETAFRALGLTPKIKYYMSQLTTMMNYLETGNTGAFLYRSIPIDESRLTRLAIEPRMTAKLGILWKKGTFLSHGLEQFIQFVKEKKGIGDKG